MQAIPSPVRASAPSRPRPQTPADGVAWITGASSGIGRALALALAAKGFTVAASARRVDDIEALVADSRGARGRIIGYPCDITDADAVAATVFGIVRVHGPIALAVLNAGVYRPVRAVPFDLAAFRQSIDVNLMGTVNGLAAIVPAMVARGQGQIAINASVAGYGGLPTSAAYGATKAGLMNLAASLKFDLDRAGVLIQIISPGFVKTPATDVNPFPMPFLMPVETAANRIVEGLATARFEITFPRRFALILKALNLLPYGAYFPLVAKATGWDRRTD